MRSRPFGSPFCVSIIAVLAWATTAFGQMAAPEGAAGLGWAVHEPLGRGLDWPTRSRRRAAA